MVTSLDFVQEQITSLILSSHLLDLTEQIRGAVKLAFNPNQTQRDELYKQELIL